MADGDGWHARRPRAGGWRDLRAHMPVPEPGRGWSVRTVGADTLEWVSPSGGTVITEPVRRAVAGVVPGRRGSPVWVPGG